MKLDDIAPADSTDFTSSFLFVGPQGIGKTIAALSFPKPAWYDNESKLESVKNWYNQPEYRRFKDDIDYRPIRNIFDFANDTLPELERVGIGDRKTLVFDSITNASRDIVNAMLKARQKMPKGGERAKIVPGNVIVPSWDEFDGEDVVLGLILGTLYTIQQKYKVNVVVCAHPHTTMGPNGKSATKIVAKGHKAPQTVLNFFQEIYHFEREHDMNGGVRRLAITQGGDFSRTAWPFLPDKLDYTDAPFYEVLESKIMENREKMGGEINTVNIAEQLPQSL